MDFSLDMRLAEDYHGASQIARVLTETWVQSHVFCPRCGNPGIEHFPNNQAVADFYCPRCNNEYELKSKKGNIGQKIVDGAYDTFIERISGNQNPDFFILTYHPIDLCVDNLWVIPKHFFTPDIVERRKPLGAGARRAGWVGCNILFDFIPQQGRIALIRNRTALDKEAVVSKMKTASLLNTVNLDARGWLLDVLNCVNNIPANPFSLNDLYGYEELLSRKHPGNHSIRAKIRQQLQLLRDKGFLEFIGQGCYLKKE